MYFGVESLSLLRKYLKELVESDCLAVEGKLFHALTVEGKNELLYKLARASTVCKSLEFLRL